MKTALSVLTLALCPALAAFAADSLKATVDSSAAPEKRSSKTVVKPCGKCTHAPCRCGFSPSYYTHHRRPAPRFSSRIFAPVKPHWTRPVSTTLVPTPRRPAAVPTREVRTTLDFAPGLVFHPPFAFDRRLCFRPTGALFGRSITPVHHSGDRGDRFGDDFPSERLLRLHLKRSRTIDTDALVPTPRRPRAVPAVTPKLVLGFDPVRNWSRAVSRGGGRGHGHGGGFSRAR